MEENLENSTTVAKSRTRKTSSLTRAQALEILQQALIEYQKVGGSVEILANYWQSGENKLALLLATVQLVDGNLVEADGTKPK